MSLHGESFPGQPSPRELIPDGQWWTVGVSGEKAVAELRLWSTQDRTDVEDTVLDHLDDMIQPKSAFGFEGSDTPDPITRAQHYGISASDIDNKINIESVERLSDEIAENLGKVASIGHVRLMSIEHI